MFKEILFKAAEAGAALMVEYAQKPFAIDSKDTINNLVTEVDKKSEAAIFEVIRKQYPDHFLLSEETGAVPKNSPYKWIIDPIDGTVNYANRIPICCVSIGLEVEGKMTMGIVYNPFSQELFFAERGAGATLNNKKIQVSSKDNLHTSCLVTGFPYAYLDHENGPLQIFEKLIRKGIPVRRLGSAALDLCWVAMGRFDGFYEHHLNPWDSAAGYLMVEEAGGRVNNFKSTSFDPYAPSIVATNGKIHEQLMEVMNGGLV